MYIKQMIAYFENLLLEGQVFVNREGYYQQFYS